jgi:TolB protein
VTPAAAPSGPRLMFYSTRNPAGWYSMAPDGSAVQPLRFDKLPSGLSLAGVSWQSGLNNFVLSLADAQGREDLYLANVQGEVIRRLTDGLGGGGEVTYSAAAGKLAFTCQGQELDICVAGLEGGGFENLTRYPGREGLPRWSPDGTRILFISTRSVVPAIWVVALDGADFTQLGQASAPQSDPSWSPDGRRVLFASQEQRNWDIYLMDADGQNATNLTNNPADDVAPKWSPDGQLIVFQSGRDGGSDLYVMSADGSGLVNITQTPADGEANFVWSPDGQRVIYSASAGGQSEIFAVNRDGGNRVNLTNDPADDVDPQWIGQ